MKKNMLLALIFSWGCLFLRSQDITVGTGMGISAYYGDLMFNGRPFSQVSPASNMSVSYSFLKRFRERFNFSYLNVRGDDKKSPALNFRERNLNFTSHVYELSLLTEYDLIDGQKNENWIYLFAGPGIFFYDPITIDRYGKKVHLHDYGTEGQSGTKYETAQANIQSEKFEVANSGKKIYGLQALSFTVGLGVRRDINTKAGIGIEFAFRFTNTDYLDDVSGAKYPDRSQVSPYVYELTYRGDEVNPLLTSPGWQPRGNPNNKDVFYSFQLCYYYKLGKQKVYDKWYFR
ncbi:MAG: hypothetical protein KGO81_07025 [Bacteroidota bacterium]|nr:hypothetical protein [Bacteroidota bacterium]